FYLINFGYVSLALKLSENLETAREGIEALSWKVGLVLVVLGAMHFFNLFVFSRIRKRTHFGLNSHTVATGNRVSFRED
ncbi:MAG: hypothetical protein JOZ52_02350, partial [Acidobacteria bacterium]|nr:hypothetical protein [Acidobacteriota bacterium]